MPVSKKRKKGGKPVQRAQPAEGGAEHTSHPDDRPAHAGGVAHGKPTNPFVQMQQGRRGAQRGR
jgi:hypothetical protein